MRPEELSSKGLGMRGVFVRGALAGGLALLFNFLLREGALAAFPPESGIESFLRIIPESIQEPAVQNLGDFAGKLGLIVASVLAVLLYGAFALLFERYLDPRFRNSGATKLERYLGYSLIPWTVYGLVLLPVFGVSFFGVDSVFGNANSFWIFPVSLLFVQLSFSFLAYYFQNAEDKEPLQQVAEMSVPEIPPRASSGRTLSRRTFVEKGVLGLGLAILAAVSFDKIVTSVVSASSSPPSTSGSGLGPINLQEAPSIFSDKRLAPLVDNELTANSSFYRVAIDLFDPTVDSSNWDLELSGSVNNPKNYALSDMQNSFPKVSQYNTFECVSNVIDGNLIGNAKWTGVRISDVIKDVGGTGAGAEYMVFYSVDGYSVAIPLSKAVMSDSILAYSMNDQALPKKHGYPLRAVIPGLYGMMSAKWVKKIEVVNSPYQGYWQTRGWSSIGTVQTVAFITIPSSDSTISMSEYNGSVVTGGMAYAGDRGISKVEVSTDGGKTWETAELKPPLSKNSWVLWAFDWHPKKTGAYSVYARATDGSGVAQTSKETGTFPNGATGYAIVAVQVNA